MIPVFDFLLLLLPLRQSYVQSGPQRALQPWIRYWAENNIEKILSGFN